MFGKKQSSPKMTSEQRYQDLLRDLTRVLSTSEQQEIDLQQAASSLMGHLPTGEGQEKARKTLKGLEERISKIQADRREKVSELIRKSSDDLKLLIEERKAQLKATSSREDKLLVIAGYQAKYSALEASSSQLIRSTIEKYTSESIDLRKEALKELKTTKTEVLSKQLEEVNAAITMQKEKRRVFYEEQRKKRAKNEKPELTEEQRLEQEVHRLSGSLITRYLVRPLMESTRQGLAKRWQGVKDKTGYSAVSRFLKNERERKENLARAKFDLNNLRTMNTLTGKADALKKAMSEDPTEGNQGTYEQIEARDTQQREVRALEKLAATVSRQEQSGSSDWMAIALAAAAFIASKLKDLFPTELLGKLRFTLGKWKSWAGLKFEEYGAKLKNVAEGVLQLAKRAGTYVADVAGDMGKWFSETKVGKFAKSAAEGAGKVGSWISEAAGKGAGAVSRGASWLAAKGRTVAETAGPTLMGWAKGIANNKLVQTMGKWAGRLGNIAMAVDVFSGIYEEANGKKVESTTLWDAILNPMEGGRFLGAKFNEKFTQIMGQDPGSWLYDLLNDDPAYQDLRASTGGKLLGPGAGGSTSVRPAAAAAGAPEVNLPAQNASPANRPKIPTKQAASVNNPLSPSSIPSSMYLDPAMMGLNMYAFGA